MSIYDAVMHGAGFRRKAEPQSAAGSAAGRAHIVGWRDGHKVAIPLPSPSAAGYNAAMQRADRFREHVSPLGGTAEWPWSQRPPVGDAALRPEFRRRGGR
jgi:hypothetical protein